MIPTHDLSTTEVAQVRIIKLGASPTYNVAIPHRHSYIELFFFLRGGGLHDIDFNPFPIQAGSIHFVTSGRIHHVRRETDSEGYVVLFDPSVLARNTVISNFLFDLTCYDVNEYSPIFEFDPEHVHKVSTILTTIWNDYQSESPLKHQFILAHLQLLCLHCIESVNLQEVDRSHDQQQYIAFRKLLHTEFKKLKKVKDYADRLNISSRKLNTLISQRSGLSASQLIHRHLILEAKRLLRTGLSAKATAFELNYDDPAHFSKFFKNQTGISPSAFQKQNLVV